MRTDFLILAAISLLCLPSGSPPAASGTPLLTPFIITSSTAATQPTTHPSLPKQMVLVPTIGAETYSFCAELDKYAQKIADDCAKRFRNPIILISHGDNLSGVWIFQADRCRGGWKAVDPIVREFAANNPDRDIVIWACNPGGIRISVPRVWHFTTDAWVEPDESAKEYLRTLSFADRNLIKRETIRNYGSAGSVWEAVTQNGSAR